MRCLKCDVCGRTTPHSPIIFSRRKTAWFEFNDDSQGGWERRLDVCDDCWKEWQNYMHNKFTCKEAKKGGRNDMSIISDSRKRR